MKTTIVPSKWYNEMVNELASNVITYGAHFTMQSEQYINSKNKWLEFKAKYKPSKDIKLGYLKGAKAEVNSLKDKILLTKSIHDKYDPYTVLGNLVKKYYLCEKQMNSLMNYMDKLNLLY
jgi:hypothetical protein